MYGEQRDTLTTGFLRRAWRLTAHGESGKWVPSALSSTYHPCRAVSTYAPPRPTTRNHETPVTYRLIIRAAQAAFVLVAAAPSLTAQQKCPATTPAATMPLTYHGGPTVAAITACDLMTRLYTYAADSMRGREAGTPDAIRATAYIEREVRRLGLRPAGDKGTFFQYMPVTERFVSQSSTITVGGQTFHPDVDFTAGGAAADIKITGDIIFGGTLGDTAHSLAADDVRGKIVVMMAPAGGGGRGGFGGGRGGAANSPLAPSSPRSFR